MSAIKEQVYKDIEEETLKARIEAIHMALKLPFIDKETRGMLLADYKESMLKLFEIRRANE